MFRDLSTTDHTLLENDIFPWWFRRREVITRAFVVFSRANRGRSLNTMTMSQGDLPN